VADSKRAVIFGAGNVGRGFLGQLFCESGYRVTFVDIDEPLIKAMRDRGSYTVRLVNNDGIDEVTVGPVSGLLSSDAEAVAGALVEATLGATAVGARVLPYIAPLLAQGIAQRARRGIDQPLNIIVCENLKNAANILRDDVLEHLDPAAHDYFERHVGFVDTVIGRMVPELSPDLRAQDTTLIIVEPYKELPVDRDAFVGQRSGDIRAEIPAVVGMEAHTGFQLFTARKLYLHNAGHAILGYLGYRRGHELGYTALEDPEIRAVLDAALQESVGGIVASYGADRAWLEDHVRDLTERFANRVLADPVLRLGRDPLRKLAPGDRLVGAARCAEKAGVTPTHLAWGIAAALAFDAPSDSRAVELQAKIARSGVAQVMHDVCGIDADEPLGKAVLERYEQLRTEPRWQAVRRDVNALDAGA